MKGVTWSVFTLKCSTWRWGSRLLVLMLLMVALASPTTIQAESVLEVLEVGWDGTTMPEAWNPVRLRVTNDGADTTGRVELVVKGNYYTGGQATPVAYPVAAYGEDVALPAGVTKDVTIWAPTLGNSGATVRLVVGGKVVAEQPVELRTSRATFWPLVGVLAESPLVARSITQVELPYQGLPMPLPVAELTATDLPTTADRLGALSALVVQGNAPATLTGEQRRMIQEWVAAGGHLIIAGGPDAARAAAVLPADALPVSFGSMNGKADLHELAVWAKVMDSASPAGPAVEIKATGGAVLAGTAERPLAWRTNIGQGTVTVLAADPSLQDLASWSGTPALLQKALEPALPVAGEDEKMRYLRTHQQQLGATQLQSVIEMLPSEAFPGWQTIALVMGGFALFVGPVLGVALWRMDRRGWVWLTVPALALLVTGGLYYFGIGREGRDLVLNVASYVKIDPDGGSQQLVAAGFFGPTHLKLAVEVPGDVSVRVNAPSSDPFPMVASAISAPPFASGQQLEMANMISAEPPYSVIGGRDTRVEFATGQWSMRGVFYPRTLGSEIGQVTAHLRLEEGLIKGTVRNDTPYPLEDAAVLVGQTFMKLGSLAPGQVAQVVLDPGASAGPMAMFKGGQPLSYRLFGKPVDDGTGRASSSGVAVAAVPAAPAIAVAPGYVVSSPPMPYPMTYERLEIPRDAETQRRVRLVDSTVSSSMKTNYMPMGPGGAAMSLTFIAFTTAQVGGNLPTVGNHPAYYLTLLEQPLNLEFPPGPFTLPASLIPVESMVPTGGFGTGSDGTVEWIELTDGSLIYTFRPLLPAKSTVDAVLLNTQQIGERVDVSSSSKQPPPVVAGQMAPRPAEAGVFSIYNWQRGQWEDLPAGQEQARLEPGGAYISGDGRIQVQVEAGKGYRVRFVAPQPSVEGQVTQ